MNKYIRTERRNFKTFWKENYAIGWITVTSLMLNMELNMILITSANGLCMHLTFLNFTADKFDSL